MMNPCVRKTWAPCGETPILQTHGRSWKKLTAIGAIALKPRHPEETKVLFKLLRNKSADAREAANFLKQLSNNIRGKVVII